MTTLTGKPILVASGTGNAGRHLADAVLAADGTAVVPSRPAEKLQAFARGRDEVDRDRLLPLLGDLADEWEASALLESARPLHGAVAGPGSFDATPMAGVLATLRPTSGARSTAMSPPTCGGASGYPGGRARRRRLVTIQGPLAVEPLFTTAGWSPRRPRRRPMLARVLMKELADSRMRVNQVVIYASLGWGNDDQIPVTGADIGRYVAHLLSDTGVGVRRQMIHHMSLAAMHARLWRHTAPRRR